VRGGVVSGPERLPGIDAEYPALARRYLVPGRCDQKPASNGDGGEVRLPRTGVVLGFETIDDGAGRVERGKVSLGLFEAATDETVEALARELRGIGCWVCAAENRPAP
jgi:hypothetical protein